MLGVNWRVTLAFYLPIYAVGGGVGGELQNLG